MRFSEQIWPRVEALLGWQQIGGNTIAAEENRHEGSIFIHELNEGRSISNALILALAVHRKRIHPGHGFASLRIKRKFFDVDVCVMETARCIRAFGGIGSQLQSAVQAFRISNQGASVVSVKRLRKERSAMVTRVPATCLAHFGQRLKITLKGWVEDRDVRENIAPLRISVDGGIQVKLTQGR